VCSGAGVNFAVALLLIGRLESMGTVAGLICAELAVSFTQFLLLRNDLNYLSLIKRAIPYNLFGIVIFFLIQMIGRLMGAGVLTVIIEVFCAGAVYLLCSMLWIVKYDKDLSSLRKFICCKGKRKIENIF
jgi:hypothetical protein